MSPRVKMVLKGILFWLALKTILIRVVFFIFSVELYDYYYADLVNDIISLAIVVLYFVLKGKRTKKPQQKEKIRFL